MPRVQASQKELQRFTRSEGRDLAGFINLYLALGKAVLHCWYPPHSEHPGNPQPVPMEAGALRRADCPQEMRPGLTVPFSSLPTSWLNVSRPAGKNHTESLSQHRFPQRNRAQLTNKSMERERHRETSP